MPSGVLWSILGSGGRGRRLARIWRREFWPVDVCKFESLKSGVLGALVILKRVLDEWHTCLSPCARRRPEIPAPMMRTLVLTAESSWFAGILGFLRPTRSLQRIFRCPASVCYLYSNSLYIGLVLGIVGIRIGYTSVPMRGS